MIVGMKRPPSLEDLMDPLSKRFRIDAAANALDPGACLPGLDGSIEGLDAVATASAAASCAAAALSGGCVDRRRLAGGQMDDVEEPMEKRPRIGGFEGCAEQASASSAGAAQGQQQQREANIRGAAENLVRTLQCAPSMEVAAQECLRVLTDFEENTRQAAFREAEEARRQSEEESRQPVGLQGQQAVRVMMRAVHHLAERCKRLEASAVENQALRQELEQSQEAQRRLAHSNEVLQGHLRIHLDGARHMQQQPWIGPLN